MAKVVKTGIPSKKVEVTKSVSLKSTSLFSTIIDKAMTPVEQE